MDFLADFLQCGTIFSYGGKDLLIGWGRRRWCQQPDQTAPFSFYFPDFFLRESNPWFTHRSTMTLSIDELSRRLSSLPMEKRENFSWEEPDKPLYSQFFYDLKDKFLKRGLLQKGVPFTVAVAKRSLQPSDLLSALLSLLKVCKESPSHLYGFWEKGSGILGATPEQLFTKSGGSKEVETVACAGTCSSEDGVLQFLNDPKESSEHAIVIEGIKESLSPLGLIEVHDRQVLHLPNLKHLYTPITFQPRKELHFVDLVRALHPTPALGAYPKSAGEQWLRSIEGAVDRKRFGAPAGFVEKGRGKERCLVAIRNMQWEEKQIAIYAGGGVVLQSELEREWKEIELKLQSIKKMLALTTHC